MALKIVSPFQRLSIVHVTMNWKYFYIWSDIFAIFSSMTKKSFQVQILFCNIYSTFDSTNHQNNNNLYAASHFFDCSPDSRKKNRKWNSIIELQIVAQLNVTKLQKPKPSKINRYCACSMVFRMGLNKFSIVVDFMLHLFFESIRLNWIPNDISIGPVRTH